MNRKQIIEKIKQNMPNFKGNEEEMEVKKVLYIYTQLGKMKSFDEKYYFGNSQTRKKYINLQKEQKKT